MTVTRYGRGKGFNYFIGEVINIDSPYQDGSCQVRAYGIEDDKEAIPDNKLRWYKVLMPPTHGQVKNSGGSHGLQKGTRVMCIFADDDEQIPMIIGTLTSTGPEESSYPTSAKPKNDPRKIDGVAGNESSLPVSDKINSLFETASNKVSSKALKKVEALSIGTQKFNNTLNSSEFIKRFDKNNTSGTISYALGVIDKVKNLSGINIYPDQIFGVIGAKILTQFNDLVKLEEFLESLESSINRNLENVLNTIQNLEKIADNISDIDAELSRKLKQISGSLANIKTDDPNFKIILNQASSTLGNINSLRNDLNRKKTSIENNLKNLIG